MKIKVQLGGNTKDLEVYIKKFKQRKALLLERLAEMGAREASVRFTTAIYDGNNDVQVDAILKDGVWKIVAKGQAVCFIEFGSGVSHNGSEPYPNPRPPDVVRIGEYGQGKGKRQAWGYYDESDNLVVTKGNPAAMPMWYASEEMRRNIEKIAREVFLS